MTPAVRYDPDQVGAELLALTRSLGRPERELAILAEGNTSQRLSADRMMVKSSGSHLGSAGPEDFVVAELAPLVALMQDPGSTQQDLTRLLDAGEIDGRRRRGSIEALVHAAIHALAPDPAACTYVGHTHPTAVVGLLASVRGAHAWDRIAYSDEAVVIGRPLYVPYAQPGIDLGRLLFRALSERVEATGEMPALILLGNHGIIATAPTADGVDAVSAMAVKGAQVRALAYAVGGLTPLSTEAVDKFFDRDDVAERRANLAQGR